MLWALLLVLPFDDLVSLLRLALLLLGSASEPGGVMESG